MRDALRFWWVWRLPRWRERALNDLTFWAAFHLPRRLIYFAGIRLWAHATTGPYGGEVATETRVDAALTRWTKG